ncbi:hypothetical protein PEC331060_09610 [Pectobacterium carotovorum subsp. carotovorum]|nr:hypothetical protein PEC331060_09610 [Pectobacterium carotovorum subsp. carotovorum]
MGKPIKHFNVRIITSEMISNGCPSCIVGQQREPQPNIQNGFIIYENLDGGIDGVNLSVVAKFIIEPEYQQEN